MTTRIIYTFAIVIIAGTFCLLGSTRVSGQTTQGAAEKGNRINLFFNLGSVVLPGDFSGAVTANWNDAWAGHVQSTAKSIKIGWRAGTIERFRDKWKAAIPIWEKTENIPGHSIQVTLLRDNGADNLVATIGDLEFNVPLKNKGDEDIFMSVIRSYQKEHCSACRSLKMQLVH